MRHRQVTAAGLLAQAEANGYKRGVHKEQDKVRDAKRHNDKTKINHDGTLRRYVLWHLGEIERDRVQSGLPVPSEEEVRAQCLGAEVEAPDLATMKDFFRFYIATSCP